MVREARQASDLHQMMERERIDVAVVDAGPPQEDGFQVALHLSLNRLCAVIVLSASASVADRVSGYRSGVDLFMDQPVELEELAAAVEQLACKRRGRQDPSGPQDRWTVDLESRRLWAPNGRLVPLTGREARLISVLMAAGGRIGSREGLLGQLDGDRPGDGRRRLDTMLSRLRSKVRDHAGMELPLVTAHNSGFSLSAALARA